MDIPFQWWREVPPMECPHPFPYGHGGGHGPMGKKKIKILK